MKILFEKEYKEELIKFYQPYFKTLQETEQFIFNAFDVVEIDRNPLQMIFQVQRFVTLATDIDKIRPARDGLRMLFLRCCMESLARLSGFKNNEFSLVLSDLFSNEGKEYILSNFRLSYYTYIENDNEIEEYYDLTLNDFLSVVKVMKNLVVHEGDYWTLNLFGDKGIDMLTYITTNNKVIPDDVFKRNGKNVTYVFKTRLQYDVFIKHFVGACISFIKVYVDKKKTTN